MLASESRNPSPFFIVGCGRGGTSLLRGLLNAHPSLAIPLESLFIPDYLRMAGRWPLEKLARFIVREPELREWGLQVATRDLDGCRDVAQMIFRLHQLYADSQGKPYWGQKTPRLVRHLDLLANHFPEARFIHLVRDPRAVVSSLIRSDVHRSSPVHGARRWLRDVQAGLQFEERCPERVMRISYEELVSGAEARVRAIMRFLGLEIAPEQLRSSPGSADYSKFYRNIHSNLERGMTDRFVDGWRTGLSADDVAVIEAATGPVMKRLGYEPVSDRAPAPRRLSNPMGWRRLRGLTLQFWRYARYRRAYLLHLVWRKWRMGLLGEFLGDISY